MALEESSDSKIIEFCENVNASRFSPIRIDLEQSLDDIFDDLKSVPLAVLQKSFDKVLEDDEEETYFSEEETQNEEEDNSDDECDDEDFESDELADDE